jgi:hypothetical protein
VFFFSFSFVFWLKSLYAIFIIRPIFLCHIVFYENFSFHLQIFFFAQKILRNVSQNFFRAKKVPHPRKGKENLEVKEKSHWKKNSGNISQNFSAQKQIEGWEEKESCYIHVPSVLGRALFIQLLTLGFFLLCMLLSNFGYFFLKIEFWLYILMF